MKKSRKLLSLLLAALMVLSLLPTTALAETTGNCQEEECAHAAAIDGMHYDTLAEAVTAAQSGDTIILLADVSVTGSGYASSAVTVSGKSITLDMNGKKLTNLSVGKGKGGNAISVESGAALTVTGNGKFIAGEGTYTGDNSFLILNRGGTLDVESGYFEGANACIGTIDEGTTTINNAEVKALAGSACLWVFNSGVLNVYGLTFYGIENDTEGCGCVWAGYLTNFCTKGGGTANIYGGTYHSYPMNKQGELKPGEINGSNYCLYDYYDAGSSFTKGSINVYGGTFIGFDPSGEGNTEGASNYKKNYVAEGYVAVKSGDKWIVKSYDDACVAKIDEQKYLTLADAIKVVNNNETITILKNIDNATGLTINTGKTFTIDFGGHAYTVNAPAAGSTGTKNQAFQILKDQTITMKNGTVKIGEANTTAESGKISRVIQNYANLTLDNMIFDDTNLAWRSDSQTASGTLTSDAMIECDNGTVSLIHNTTLTIADANKASRYAFAMEDWNEYYPDGVKVTVDGAIINGHIRFYSDGATGSGLDSTLTIKTDTVNGKIYDNAQGVPSGKITETIADRGLREDEENVYVIAPFVAQIGTDEDAQKFTTLADAIAAVPANGATPTTITMLRDVENAEGMAVPSGKNFIVDFDRHTYTLNAPGAGSVGTERNGFQLLRGSTVVFKNGTINVAEENLTDTKRSIMRIIQNYANLTLEDMTIDATNQYGDGNYVMSFNSDPVSITGNTSVILKDGATVAFDADGNWGGYPRCKVTVNTTGTIDGYIELGQGELDIQNVKATGIVLCTECGEDETTNQTNRINISGGLYSSKVNAAYIADGYVCAALATTDPAYADGYRYIVKPIEVIVKPAVADTETGKITVGDEEIKVEGTGEGQAATQEAANKITETLNNPEVTGFADTKIEEATQVTEQTTIQNVDNTNFDLSMILNEVKKEAAKQFNATVTNDGEITVKTTNGDEGETFGDTDVSKKITVDLTAAAVTRTVGEATTTTVTSMTFEVKPVATITVTDGEDAAVTVTAIIPNEAITTPITFRLPVDSSVTETWAAVYHEGNFMGNYQIKTENGKKYIEVSSKEFSEFKYVLFSSATAGAKIGDVPYQTLAEAVAAVQTGDTITLLQNVEGGSIPVSRVVTFTIDKGGHTNNATIAAGDGYTLSRSGNTYTVTKYVAPTHTGGGSSSYAVTVNSAKNGTFTVDKKNASSGSTVTITVAPDKGFTLETLTVTDKNGKEIEVKNLGNNKYSFKMPSGKVTVKATFMEDNSMLNFFVDVKATDYFYDAVLWAAENGITKGTDDVHFSPSAPVTRAQVVTFLWRAAGCPEPTVDASKFVDVKADSYYEKAVAWAVEQGITTGVTAAEFKPDDICKRGQIVSFLYRYAKGGAVGVNPFNDVKADAYYYDAVLWAVENGVTGGTTATTFSPANTCTRAQVVTFLYRWMVK